jgi:hypothetical protein
MKELREDYISRRIKDHYLQFGNYDFESIKKYFSEDGKIFLDDEVIKKRIEKIEKENERFPK